MHSCIPRMAVAAAPRNQHCPCMHGAGLARQLQRLLPNSPASCGKSKVEGAETAQPHRWGLFPLTFRIQHDHHGTVPVLQDPVITPHGYLFSKEAILENLLAQVCGSHVDGSHRVEVQGSSIN